MKNLSDIITQEQKETVIKFVANWLRQNKPVISIDNNEKYRITDGDVEYTIRFSIFDEDKLFSVWVSNRIMQIHFMVEVEDVTNQKDCDFIETYIINKYRNDETPMTNNFFNKITNLEVDSTEFREKKIEKIVEKIKPKNN